MRQTKRTSALARQLALPLGRPGRGGARLGAGRKRAPGSRELPHVARPKLDPRKPLHVTVRLRSGLPSLREQALLERIRRAITDGKTRFGARIVHYSVQRDHMHLIMEAHDRGGLSRAMRGLGVRVARGLNGLLGCKGRVIGDRYHARALGTPRVVRNALRYVLLNFRRHGRTGAFDRASSGAAFDGWSHGDPRACLGDELVDAIERSVAPATRWLSTLGWRIHGRIDPTVRPGPKPD